MGLQNIRNLQTSPQAVNCFARLHRRSLCTLSGLGNVLQSEQLPGALPLDQNSPQRPPKGLYAEQLSGTAFTVPRGSNQWAWTYRKLPSVAHGPRDMQEMSFPALYSPPQASWSDTTPPIQLRWGPREPQQPADFIESLETVAGSGSGEGQYGASALRYAATKDMKRRYFYHAEAELLIVPQKGSLDIFTEFGRMKVSPLSIAVIPRGVRFQVKLPDGEAVGYCCENFGASLRLPELGPIGSSTGLANPRHFIAPQASCEEDLSGEGPLELICAFQGKFWKGHLRSSPLDVVAWYGNLWPYTYDLRLFTCINTVTNDHPDPSIYTVLTSPGVSHGTANLDFVIFPPRWIVAENTFRPPWFHRNTMSEFMGLIDGVYDAKSDAFSPGGCSIHNKMVPHGPDVSSWKGATACDTTEPQKLKNTMAFMFETQLTWKVSPTALNSRTRQPDYSTCWDEFPRASS